MAKHTITVFRGDGIGPELVEAALKVLDHAGAPLEYEIFDVGAAEYERNGKLIPDEAYESFEKNKVMLKSPITTPIGKGFRSLNVTLRRKYDLFANIRPVKTFPAIDTPFRNVDIVIFRENTEGLYTGQEEVISDDELHATKIVTRKATDRIIRSAFDFAVNNGRKKVTCVHKANILKVTDGFFLDRFREIAIEYPSIQTEDIIIDSACMQLVMRPQEYDVMVMMNLYGDMLSDLCSGLVGGLGVVASQNLGTDYAMFEAVHGSAPDIAGKRLANPTAFLLSACLMLDHLGERECADKIRGAIDAVLTDGTHKTRDLKGTAGMDEFVDAILAELN